MFIDKEIDKAIRKFVFDLADREVITEDQAREILGDKDEE